VFNRASLVSYFIFVGFINLGANDLVRITYYSEIRVMRNNDNLPPISGFLYAVHKQANKTELNDPQALVAEFQERVDQSILKALSRKIPSRKAEDLLAKVG
jgi:hypothetical protein